MVEVNRCPRCQGDVSVDAPEGLCPECLLHQALQGQAASPDQPDERRSPFPVFVAPPAHELAARFPQLEILALVGQGGMGAVYRARQTKLDRLVALKVLPPEVARDGAFAERFTREARSLARLNHPNVVTVFDFGETDGLYYFTMEFVDGQNVRQLVEAGRLAAEAAVKLAMQVCDALQYAHDEGLVHRDIKPENILVDRKGRVKIADFGLARLVGLTPAYLTLTGSHEVMGTLYYMAPEQLRRSHRVDHRADIFSLGVVLYEMLTGELPVGRFAWPSHKARGDRRLDAIVLKALAREPEQRYQDAAELKRDLEAVLAAPAPAALPLAAEPLPAAAGRVGNWPCVRFTIPLNSWFGGEARGEVYRDNEALMIEFQQGWLFRRLELKQVRIPFRDIVSLSCQTESWLPTDKMPRWMRNLQRTELIIKTTSPKVLAGLPFGKQGRGHLVVHAADRDAARQLVEGVVHQTSAAAMSVLPARAAGGAPAPTPQRQVLVPAAGLLLTGLVALAWSLALSVEMMHKVADGRPGATFGHLAAIIFSWFEAWAAAYLLAGAIQMLRLRNYRLVLSAACLALVPWSPAWVLGLPIGIWALVVLRRREVSEAFQASSRMSPSAPPFSAAAREAVRKSPVASVAEEKGDGRRAAALGRRVQSLLRSVGGYFVSLSAGRHADSRMPRVEEPHARPTGRE
jgi:serine/threonine protein kinase